MATSDSPLSVPDITLAVARGAVSGSGGTELANGQTLRITGSGFEAVANPLPRVYDDFDYAGYVAGQDVPEGANPDARWTQTTDFSAGYVFDDAVTMPGRRLSAKAKGKKAKMQDPYDYSGGQAGSVDGIYSSGWIWFSESTDTPPQPGLSSNKIIRVFDNDSGTRTAWQATEHPFLYVDQSAVREFETISTYPSREVFESFPQQWHRFEQYSNVNGTGPIKLWLDGKLVTNLTGAFKAAGGVGNIFRTAMIGYDISQLTAVNDTLIHRLGDFCDQPTLARIELSNDAVFTEAAYQTRYYQLCSARTTTEVTLPDLYLGGLDAGSPVYMHEIKSDGSVQSVELVVGTNVEIL